MIDELTLIAKSNMPAAGGFGTMPDAEVDVYCDVRSVKRADWNAANAAGTKLDVVFIVNSDEYRGQQEVRHGDVGYKVVRTYQIGFGRTELTCEVIN